MAAKKTAPAKNKPRGRRKPIKRTINLVVVNENKVNPLKAILGILAILVLAAVFSKFLVMDRLSAMSAAEARVAQLQSDLNTTNSLLSEYGELETTYAHYTMEGMTAAELNQVDRVKVLRLVVSMLPVIEPQHMEVNVDRFLNSLFRPAPRTGNGALDAARQAARDALKARLIPLPEYSINNWSVSGNMLTLDVYGRTLERLNRLARRFETSPIVNTCTITTANMDINRKLTEGVYARFQVYLQQPSPEAEAEAAPEEEKESKGLNFGAVTQFVGGEASGQ